MARNEGGSASSEGFFQPSASGSVNSSADFQRLCDNALKECPISFGEGATVADFGDRLRRYCVHATGVHLFSLRHLSGLLHHSNNLDRLPAFLLPVERRGESSASPSECLRRQSELEPFAQIFCAGDCSRARALAAAGAPGLPAAYRFPPASRMALTASGPDASPHSPPPASAGPGESPPPASAGPGGTPPPASAGPGLSDGVARRLHPGDGAAPASSPARSPRGSPGPAADAGSRELLSRIFPHSANFDVDIAALNLILKADFDILNPPPLASFAPVLEALSGERLLCIAEAVNLPLPDFTKRTSTGWGVELRATAVIAPLARRLHVVLHAFASFRSAHAPSPATALGAFPFGGGGRPVPPFPGDTR